MLKIFPVLLVLFISLGTVSNSTASDLLSGNETILELNKEDDTSRPLAVIRRFNPDVLVKRLENDWVEAENAKPLFNADSLITTESGFALIQFLDNSTVRMRPNSLLVIGGDSSTRGNTTKNISLDVGEIFFNVTGIGSSTEVNTPSAVAAVRGTQFSTTVDEDGGTTIVVFSGSVVVSPVNGSDEIELGPGESVYVFPDGITYEITSLTPEELEELRNELESDPAIDGPRFIELRFINADGEIEVIIIEFDEN